MDPPPDLVIELDITSPSFNKLPFYTQMGVPEVWRLAGQQLVFLHLQPDETYQARDQSRNFPVVPVAAIARFLELEAADSGIRSLVSVQG